jgi:hypothetical protein
VGNLILLSLLSSFSVVDTGGKFTAFVTAIDASVNYAILSLPPVVLLILVVHLEL